WGRVGRVIARRPGAVWVATVAAMAPFAAYAAARSGAVSYDLTRNVPPGAPSAAGLRAVGDHFPAGAIGPVTVLLRNDRVDFGSPEGAAPASGPGGIWSGRGGTNCRGRCGTGRTFTSSGRRQACGTWRR